jgi:hypothetical protein
MSTGETIDGRRLGRRCYVLGAGFSKPLGFPLAGELMREVWNHATHGMDDFGAETRAGWLATLTTAYPRSDFNTTWPDFEDLITVLDEWEQYRADYEGAQVPPGPLQAAHLKRVLLKHLGLLLCEKLNACTEDLLAQVRGFAKRAVEDGNAVVSFNWDLLLEAAAADVGVAVSYGGAPRTGPQVAKPHGSLNLAEMPREEYEQACGSINVHSVSVDFEKGSSVVVRADNPRDAANRIVHPFREALLVEPTARKSYRSAWLALQWWRALNTLRAAEEVVVMGYSLPPTDFRPRILLQLAALDRLSLPRVYLVDPHAAEVAAGYRRWISAPVQETQTGWIEWLRTQ